jgi:hypothetical protein
MWNTILKTLDRSPGNTVPIILWHRRV